MDFLNELYNLMESFFHISESFFWITTILKNNMALGLSLRGGEGICADQHTF